MGTGVGVGVAVGVGVGVGVGTGVGVGVAVGVGVGVGVGVLGLTVIVSCVEKKKPVESHARIKMVCFPAAMESAAVSCAFALLALFTEST